MSLTDTTLLKTRAYVGGEWIDADSGATFDVVNPADGSVVGTVADLGVEETRRGPSRPPTKLRGSGAS